MDDLHYVPGDFYRICDRSGFKIRSGRTRKEWNNLIVWNRLWEIRQPQDFVKGIIDDQTVPQPRPRQPNVFLGILMTTTTADAALGSTTLQVVSTAQMQNGDTVEIMLDDGTFFKTTINGAPGSNSITLAAGLPSIASSGALVEDLTQNTQANIG